MEAATSVSVSLFNQNVSLFTFIGPFPFFSGLLFITPASSPFTPALSLFMLIPPRCIHSRNLV
jgi:hypothetical protein